jgi:hypothetical protein
MAHRDITIATDITIDRGPAIIFTSVFNRSAAPLSQKKL